MSRNLDNRTTAHAAGIAASAKKAAAFRIKQQLLVFPAPLILHRIGAFAQFQIKYLMVFVEKTSPI
jgi:hypothetical protein